MEPETRRNSAAPRSETLPADWYVDPAVYEAERRRIFARDWQLFARASALAGPGDYVAETIAGYPIFVLRDREGGLRGFHNVCRHRAARILAEGEGRAELLRCPYHGWTYDGGGRLKATPGFGEDAGFDRADYGLFPIRVESWRGLVFVNLDLGAGPLADGLGDMARHAEPFPLERYRFCRRQRYDIDCNWKTYIDNYLEGYHIPLLHPELNASVEFRSYRVENGDRICLHRANARDGAAYQGLWLWRYPNQSFAVYARGMNFTRVLPLGPDRTRLAIDFFFADLSPEAMPANEKDMAATCRVVEEDFPICAAVQRNFAAGIYSCGPLSPRHEAGLGYFHDLVEAALGGVAKGPITS
jgi:choline monooxygenase